MRAVLGHVTRQAGKFALDLLLPPHCLTCDQPVGTPGQFCTSCFEQTNFITAPFCHRCGVPFETAERGGPSGACPACVADPPPWGEARAALRYDAQAKRLILPFKYGDRIETARALAPMMARAGAALLRQADWLIPVPLHRRRMLSRRYNQAALLARELARISGRPALLDGLRRLRPTNPLAEMSPARRSAEMEAAIAVQPARCAMVNGARLLLIDDVLTSGATARACVAALLAAGAVRVDVLAAARVRSQHWDA